MLVSWMAPVAEDFSLQTLCLVANLSCFEALIALQALASLW